MKSEFKIKPVVWRIEHPTMGGPLDVVSSEAYHNLERKVELLKRLVLLVHPSVSNVEMNTTSLTQWSEFIKEFPDEK